MFANLVSDMLATVLVSLIRFYQLVISPLLPARCRFYPTCSSYGIKAIQRHGGVKGGWLTVKRICRCHPWGGSDVDFVPLALSQYQYQFFTAHWQSLTGYGAKFYKKPV